jgi:hypothetical protein
MEQELLVPQIQVVVVVVVVVVQHPVAKVLLAVLV